MHRMIWRVGGLAVLLVFVGGVLRAADAKPTDEGKAAEFKGKAFDLKAKGEAAILLSCPAGKEVTATTKGEKETDVRPVRLRRRQEGSGQGHQPRPEVRGEIHAEKSGKYKLLVQNLGPGASKVTLEVKVADCNGNPPPAALRDETAEGRGRTTTVPPSSPELREPPGNGATS